MGLPHSMTLARFLIVYCFRQVLECGSPMPLSYSIFGEGLVN